MTNPVALSNVQFIVSKKKFEFVADLKCCGNLLSAGNEKKVTVAANVDKTIAYNNPTNPIRAPKAAGTKEVTLSWVLSRVKKGETEPKKYDKTINIPITTNTAPSTHTVLLGQIGSVTFTADAVDEAEQRRLQQIEADRIAREAQQKAAAEEAERQRLQQIEDAKKQAEQQLAATYASLNAELDDKYKYLNGEFDVAVNSIESHRAHLKKLDKEEKDAIEWEIKNRPPVWPSLHPELRIAKLFQEPPMVEDDPVFDAICAPPSQLPPPASNDDYTYQGGSGDSPSPSPQPPHGRQQQQQQNKPSPPGTVTTTVRPGPRAGDRAGSLPGVNHETPLDVLHGNSNNPDTAKQGFSATGPDEDFGALSPEDEEDPDYQPDGKFYRRKKYELGTNPLLSMQEELELPPLDSIPRVRDTTAHDETTTTTTADGTSPKRVSFKGTGGDVSSRTESAAADSASTGTTGASAANNNNADSSPNEPMARGGKRKNEKEARFEMELEPTPPLMTALLHLSRNGGNLDATIPIERQSPVRIRGGDDKSNNNGDVFSRLGPSRVNLSPSRTAAAAADGSPSSSCHRDHSMSPRRQLPLVFSDYGEVVSRTNRADSRAVPSFMRRPPHEVRRGTNDPAQSYWNCFAPQKAQNLVGVRMPASAVTAFEQAADDQVTISAAAVHRRPKDSQFVPPARNTSPNKSLRTPEPGQPSRREATSLRKIVRDAGESSSSRAARRMFQ